MTGSLPYLSQLALIFCDSRCCLFLIGNAIANLSAHRRRNERSAPRGGSQIACCTGPYLRAHPKSSLGGLTIAALVRVLGLPTDQAADLGPRARDGNERIQPTALRSRRRPRVPTRRQRLRRARSPSSRRHGHAGGAVADKRGPPGGEEVRCLPSHSLTPLPATGAAGNSLPWRKSAGQPASQRSEQGREPAGAA